MQAFGTDHGSDHRLKWNVDGLLSTWRVKEAEACGFHAHMAGDGKWLSHLLSAEAYYVLQLLLWLRRYPSDLKVIILQLYLENVGVCGVFLHYNLKNRQYFYIRKIVSTTIMRIRGNKIFVALKWNRLCRI